MNVKCLVIRLYFKKCDICLLVLCNTDEVFLKSSLT